MDTIEIEGILPTKRHSFGVFSKVRNIVWMEVKPVLSLTSKVKVIYNFLLSSWTLNLLRLDIVPYKDFSLIFLRKYIRTYKWVQDRGAYICPVSHDIAGKGVNRG